MFGTPKNKIKFGTDYEISDRIGFWNIWIKNFSTGKTYVLTIDAEVRETLSIKDSIGALHALLDCFRTQKGIELSLLHDRLRILIPAQRIKKALRNMFFEFFADFSYQEQSIRTQTQEMLQKDKHEIPRYLIEYIWNLQDRVGDEKLQFSDAKVSFYCDISNSKSASQDSDNGKSMLWDADIPSEVLAQLEKITEAFKGEKSETDLEENVADESMLLDADIPSEVLAQLERIREVFKEEKSETDLEENVADEWIPLDADILPELEAQREKIREISKEEKNETDLEIDKNETDLEIDKNETDLEIDKNETDLERQIRAHQEHFNIFHDVEEKLYVRNFQQNLNPSSDTNSAVHQIKAFEHSQENHSFKAKISATGLGTVAFESDALTSIFSNGSQN